MRGSPSGGRRTATMVAALSLLVGGCFEFDRSLIPDGDAGGRVDAGRGDAGRGDAGIGDGGARDADPDGCVPDSAEICEGEADEDCDGTVDESCDCVNGATRGCVPDVGCAGSQACADGAWGACVADAFTRSCNGLDDDCDGAIDEDSSCVAETGCAPFRSGDSAYLFCESALPWMMARAACQAVGYELVTIESAAEDEALLTAAGASGRTTPRWWIGLADLDGDGTLTWASGSASAYRNPSLVVNPGECVVLDASASDWGADPCTLGQSHICEAGP